MKSIFKICLSVVIVLGTLFSVGNADAAPVSQPNVAQTPLKECPVHDSAATKAAVAGTVCLINGANFKYMGGDFNSLDVQKTLEVATGVTGVRYMQVTTAIDQTRPGNMKIGIFVEQGPNTEAFWNLVLAAKK